MGTLSNRIHHRQKESNDDELKFYKGIYTSSGEGIFITRPNGDILSANPAACRLLERSEDDIISVGRNGVINTEDPRLPGMLKERAENGFVKGELTFKKRDGSLFPVDFTSNVFEFAPGDLRTVIIFRDISEQKKSEELLKASERKY
nr:PAS domain-containing protein [Bacteroidales bacterium]